MNYKLDRIVLYHRKQSGLSRNQLAELAGVGKTVIYDIEKGQRDDPVFHSIKGH